jgi:hypothetical protein
MHSKTKQVMTLLGGEYGALVKEDGSATNIERYL